MHDWARALAALAVAKGLLRSGRVSWRVLPSRKEPQTLTFQTQRVQVPTPLGTNCQTHARLCTTTGTRGLTRNQKTVRRSRQNERTKLKYRAGCPQPCPGTSSPPRPELRRKRITKSAALNAKRGAHWHTHGKVNTQCKALLTHVWARLSKYWETGKHFSERRSRVDGPSRRSSSESARLAPSACRATPCRSTCMRVRARSRARAHAAEPPFANKCVRQIQEAVRRRDRTRRWTRTQSHDSQARGHGAARVAGAGAGAGLGSGGRERGGGEGHQHVADISPFPFPPITSLPPPILCGEDFCHGCASA